MHEYGLASRLADEALDRAQGRPLKKVLLNVGALASGMVEPLRLYLDLAFEEKGLSKVSVEARVTPAACRCSCGMEYEINKMTDGCPACGSFQRQILRGRDCVVESVEVGKA